MKFYKYCNLVNSNTNYANRMKTLSNRIFGDVVRPTNEKSMRVKLIKNPNLIIYFRLIVLCRSGSKHV